MSEEVWRQVPGHTDYEVSNLGNVRSWRPFGGSRKRPLVPTYKAVTRMRGYVRVCLYSKTVKPVHRLVLEAFVGPCPEGMQACHNNGIRDDNRVENLRWDTPKGNSLDKAKHGTKSRRYGECNVHSKLSDAQVEEIRSLRGKVMGVELARMYGVSPALVCMIQRNQTRTHGSVAYP